MFAFLMCIGDIEGFIRVYQTNKVSYETLTKLVHNSQICFIKALHYIKKHKDVYNRFDYFWNGIVGNIKLPNKYKDPIGPIRTMKEYGIKKDISLEKYFYDFNLYNSYLVNVKMYIHNLKLYKVTPKDDENYWMLIQQEMLSPEYQNFLNMFKELKKRKLNFGKINNNFNIY